MKNMIYSKHGLAITYTVRQADGRYAGFIFCGFTPFFEGWFVMDDYGDMVAA